MPPPSALPAGPVDVRLVTVDMDGTLLDPDHRVPAALADLLVTLADRGVAFCPASGRQLASVRAALADHVADLDALSFVAENGALVVHRGAVVSTDTVEPDVVRQAVAAVRALVDGGTDVGIVVSGTRCAYVERHDGPFLREVERYYTELETVTDLLAVDDDVLKVAVFDPEDVAATAEPALAHLRPGHQVVVSGRHWVDVMGPTTHKGHGVRALQDLLGVTAEQTVAFGDYLNDLEMLDAAHWSFAMRNAHPEVLDRARLVAPGNHEDGVVRVLTGLLGLDLSPDGGR